MKISEYIKHLQELQEKHGDLEVYFFHLSGRYIPANPPKFMHLKLLEGKEQKVREWHSWDKPELKGKPVINI